MNDRLTSGHEPLDAVLGGGLPANAISLLMGRPGSGKTILAQQYVFRNATPERPSIYFTTVSEPLEKIVRFGQSLNFFDRTAIGTSVYYEDLGVKVSHHGLTGVTEQITTAIKERRPGVIVIDSFKALHAFADGHAEFRLFLHELSGRLGAFPVASLWATGSPVLPVAVALADGERPGAGIYAGALLCLVAIVLASSAGQTSGAQRHTRPVRAIAYGMAAGVSFGLFFLLIRNAGQTGDLSPVAAARTGELAVVLTAAAVLRRGLQLRHVAGSLLLAAGGAGVIDVAANICYVAATRTGMFGLAVVLASLYPGITVLLARVVLGERLRWVQQAGLGLAAIGILLVAA